jgi:hydrogenase maturation protease
MPDSPAPLLVLGLGNLLCTDDGVGVVAVQALAETRIVPEGVRVLDGGTLGLSLLPYLEDAERAILVDAIEIDAPPGTLVRLEGDDVGPAVATRLSVHQVGVSDLIEAARWRGRIPTTLVLLGVVPQSTELGVDLSPPVRAALPDLLNAVCDEARALGFPLPPRRRHDVSPDSVPLAGGPCRGVRPA